MRGDVEVKKGNVVVTFDVSENTKNYVVKKGISLPNELENSDFKQLLLPAIAINEDYEKGIGKLLCQFAEEDVYRLKGTDIFVWSESENKCVPSSLKRKIKEAEPSDKWKIKLLYHISRWVIDLKFPRDIKALESFTTITEVGIYSSMMTRRVKLYFEDAEGNSGEVYLSLLRSRKWESVDSIVFKHYGMRFILPLFAGKEVEVLVGKFLGLIYSFLCADGVVFAVPCEKIQ